MNTDESQMQVLPDLTNMVSVQPEATVSRTVMHTEGATWCCSRSTLANS